MTITTSLRTESDKNNILVNLQSNNDVDPNWVLMSNQLPNNKQEILARYGDIEWVLPDAICSTGLCKRKKTLKFQLLDCSNHIDPMKIAISRYYLNGAPGRARPRANTIFNFYFNARFFLDYLSSINITDIRKINTMICANYVSYCKKKPNKKGNYASTALLVGRFWAVENLQILLKNTNYSFEHPWPESSAFTLAQHTNSTEGKTPIIPDEVAQLVMKKCSWLLGKSEYYLSCSEIVYTAKSDSIPYLEIKEKLVAAGYNGGLRALSRDISALQDACIFIILMTTAIRIHELLNLETGSSFSRINNDGERQHWIKSISEKTKEGTAEWICPEICHRAVIVAERIAKPIQTRLTRDIACNKNTAQKYKQQEEQSRLFLGIYFREGSIISTLTSTHINSRLKKFVHGCGTNWDFSSHQCRRTFAAYVVRHILGDLRYLRDHYKHWSLDMTAMYAASQAQDRELYDEIYIAMTNKKQAKVSHWLDPETSIAGGMGERIKVFRSKGEHVRTYNTRADMLKGVSDTISIRATGVAWCTSDRGGCNGGYGVDRTKCGDCDGSIIDDKQQSLWEAIYAQQLELINMNDIGETGNATARKALIRCEKVLTELGADIDQLKKAVSA